ncbi:MAG: EF-hand domain-containing protein [Bacteroidota bacterium]
MKRSIKLIMTIAVVGLFSVNATAQNKCGGAEMKNSEMPEMAKFSDIDVNNDGKISEEECSDFRAKRKEKMEGTEMKEVMSDYKPPKFSEMDINGDGFLSPEEFKAHQDEHMKEIKAKMKANNGEMKCGSGKCGGK